MQHLHSALVDTVSCIIIVLLCVVLPLRSHVKQYLLVSIKLSFSDCLSCQNSFNASWQRFSKSLELY